MDPRFRMIMQQQRPNVPGGPQQQQQQQQPQGQLQMRGQAPMLGQTMGQQQQQQQGSMPAHPEQPNNQAPPQTSASGAAPSSDLDTELDLGVADEDLLGMAEDFNIMEFADALEVEGSDGSKFLDDLEAEDEASQDSTKEENASAASSTPSSTPSSVAQDSSRSEEHTS